MSDLENAMQLNQERTIERRNICNVRKVSTCKVVGGLLLFGTGFIVGNVVPAAISDRRRMPEKSWADSTASANKYRKEIDEENEGEGLIGKAENWIKRNFEPNTEYFGPSSGVDGRYASKSGSHSDLNGNGAEHLVGE